MNAVQWHRASAFEPDTYRDLIAGKSAVVHTLGILLEDAGYKDAIARGDVLGLLGSVVRGATGSGPASNPLKTAKEARGTYEAMNRDSGESRRELRNAFGPVRRTRAPGACSFEQFDLS